MEAIETIKQKGAAKSRSFFCQDFLPYIKKNM